MEYRYLYVMDYSDCTISEIELTDEDNESLNCPEILLDKYGFNDGNCGWMFSSERIGITRIEYAVKDMEQLKRLCSEPDGRDFYIKLNCGLRSSKHISYDGEKWWVLNLSDDTEQHLSDEELSVETNIVTALNNNVLILDY